MIFVCITSFTLKKNPVKRARLWVWAVKVMLQANEMALHAESNVMGGKFLTMTVWRSREDMLVFENSGARLEATQKNVIQDVATRSMFYSYETSRVPSWDEAFETIEFYGEHYHPQRSMRELPLKQRNSEDSSTFSMKEMDSSDSSSGSVRSSLWARTSWRGIRPITTGSSN